MLYFFDNILPMLLLYKFINVNAGIIRFEQLRESSGTVEPP